jgi:hypothetical protein
MNYLLTYAVMLDLLIVAYVQFVIMLRIKESAKCLDNMNTNILKQGLFICVARLPECYRTKPYQKYGFESGIFMALGINK